jgi:hypothetical protein
MSDLTSHSRDDLVELPCDTEGNQLPVARAGSEGTPAGCKPVPSDPHLATECPECRHGLRCSPALCNRRRELHARLAESVRMLNGASNVIELSHARSARAGRR